ncbi:MAG: tetratricopeptide repeat protein [Candidatus Acidiferrales bacterium]
MPVASAPLDEAQQLYRMGEFDRAINRYQQICRSGADEAAAYAGLARVYMKLKKPDEAFAAASKAVDRDPGLATVHSALGEVYLRQGKLYEAQQEFLFPFKTKQVDARSYLGLARLYQATFNFKRAKVTIDKAYGLDPTDPDIRSAWIQTRPRSEQIQALEGAIASPNDFYSRVEKARFKQRLALLKDRAEHPERTCSLANRPESAELSLEPMHMDGLDYRLKLDVRVNGQNSRLLVETSKEGLTINDQIAQKAGVQMVVRTDVEGFGDQNPPEGYIGFVPSIGIGNLEFKNCYVTVIERMSAHSFYTQVEGTVSAEIFSSYFVDLDLAGGKLRLQALPPRPATEDPEAAAMDAGDVEAKGLEDRYTAPEMSTWDQLYDFGGEYFMPVRVNSSPPKLFVISTGDFTTIAPQITQDSASNTNRSSPKVFGANGAVEKTSRTGPLKLEFSNFYYLALSEPSFGLTQESDRVGTEIPGILGRDILRNCDIKIDYRDGLIHFSNGKNK